MKRNFRIDQSIALRDGTRYADLHNYYVLAQVTLEILLGTVHLVFARNSITATTDLPDEAVLQCSRVSRLRCSDGITNSPEVGLEEIGFKEPGDDDMDWLTPEGRQSEICDIVFRLTNDEFVRIGCESIDWQ